MIMKKNTAIARFAIFIFTVMCSLPVMAQDENIGFHQALKTKFIEGNAGFMSLVAIALIVGLAFCIERIIYLHDFIQGYRSSRIAFDAALTLAGIKVATEFFGDNIR